MLEKNYKIVSAATKILFKKEIIQEVVIFSPRHWDSIANKIFKLMGNNLEIIEETEGFVD